MKRFYTALFMLLAATSWATNHQVSVGSNFFNPQNLIINQGDTVTWTNTQGFHNANGSTSTFPNNPASFTSGSVAGPGWVYSYTFTIPGLYNYQCDPHIPGMVGTVTVNAAALPVYNIADVRTNDSNGEPDSLGVVCALRGTVTSIDFDGNNGVNFFIHDGTAGMAIFNFNDVDAYVVTPGDSIYVEGDIDQFNGLTQLFVDSIYVISTGNTVKNPTVVTTLDETTEADLIRLNGLTLVTPSQWPTSGSANVDVTNGTDTLTMRIDSDTDIDGSPAPTGQFDLIGLGGQFDNSSPYFDGYQILPRSTADIITQTLNLNIYTIASVTTNDANGVADSLNQPANLAGTVTSIDFDGNNGVNFFIHDNTGGIAIFNFNDVDAYVVTPGDSIYVEGDIDQFNGLTQLFVDSISVISTGNTVKNPIVVTTLDETTEAELIRLNGLTLVTPSQWPASGSANVDVTNGTDTLTMRIDSDTDIDGSPAPTGQFDLIGLGGQFDNSSPYFDGYQILPRSLADVITAGGTTPCGEVFISEYIEGGSNDKALEIYNPSMGAINMSGYSISIYNNGNTSPSNSFTFPSISLASGEVYVIANSQSNATILAAADTTSSVTFFNGDDAVVLFNGTDTVDIIGVVGVDPGSGWTVGSGSTANNTLVRKLAVDAGTTDWSLSSTQWDVYPSSTSNFIGSHSSACLGGIATGLPEYEIADITGVDTLGVADSLNIQCILRGTVSGNNLRSSGVEFWMIDSLNTDGLLVRNTSYAFYTPVEGDKLWVRGSVSQFNGLIQFVPDSINVLSSGNALPPAVATTTLDEVTEGRLNVMNNMTIVSGWQSTSGSANVTISDGANTFTMRVDFDTYIFDSIPNAPTGLVNIYGHGGQFDGSSPYDGGYQINPRYAADIVPVVATTPTINFPAPSQTVTEGAGTLNITLPISPVSANAETVKIYVAEGAGITSGDYSLSPAAVNDTMTLNVAAGDSASFSITLVDDIIQENDETITFSIESVSAGLTVGPVATHVLTIADNDVFIPTYAISDLKGLDSDVLPDSLGVTCKLVGTVLGVDMQGLGSSNVSFTIHDGTVGFGVFMANSTYTVTEGDLVRVIGDVSHFNGLAQISADSIAFISANNPLPTPTVITEMDESTESDLIRFNNATIIDPTQWTNSGSGFNVDITDGVDTIVIRIDKDVVDVFQAPAPVGTFDVVGIGGQFDNSAPHNSGYQFLPRYLADFIYPTPPYYPIAITEIMPGSNDPNSAVNEDWWELTNYGNASVNLDGFSWDDDSENPGTVVFPNITINPGESFVVWNGLSTDEAAFDAAWGLDGRVTIISSDEMSGNAPGLGQGGDAVVLYDTSATVIEICNAMFNAANAGFSVEFDTTCIIIGNAVNGARGAYTSTGGDVGSPGNVAPIFGLQEFGLAGIEAYPNPTTGLVNLTLPEGNKQVKLVNVAGVSVLNESASGRNHQLNLESLPSGVYMLHITWNGKQAIGKIVKQ